MSAKLIHFTKQNWMLVSVLLAAMIIAGWFAFKFIANFIFFNDPRNQDGDLKGWMNPHFVMIMYDLPRPLVIDILELPKDRHEPRRLHDIAAGLGLTMEELTERVRERAAAHRETQE